MRKPRRRCIRGHARFNCFKPAGIPAGDLPRINLQLDEFEAIRLADHLGLDHLSAASAMEISRPTFSRLIERARSKVAAFLLQGARLDIHGGPVRYRLKGDGCHPELRDGSGMTRGVDQIERRNSDEANE
jgi:predicted DNA-binding protein (UPF0251 family)